MRIIWVLAGFFLFCLSSVPVFACSIPTENPNMTATPMPTIEDYSQIAPVIFLGTVIQVDESTNWWSRRYEIQVARYLKGSGYNHVLLYNYRDFCAYGLGIGQEFIFFVREYNAAEALPAYDYIDNALPSDEVEIFAITGQSNSAQSLPLEIQLARIAEKGDLAWLYIPLSILLVFMGITLFWAWRRGRRKTKAKRETL